MARLDKKDLNKSDEGKKEEGPKVYLVPRAVSQEEMFNLIHDKLDQILAKLNEK